MLYVLPMAGRGSRFRNVGINTPKPLIKLAGQELVFHSLEGLPITAGDTLILISLKPDQVKNSIEKNLKIRYPNVNIHWIEINEVTEGQLCTVLLAKALINKDEPLIIHNCDTSFRSNINSIIKNQEIDGAISCFKASGSQWSYAKFNELGYATETAEKIEISDNATIGLYYFKNGSIFVDLAEQMIANKEKTKNEYYIAPLYNKLIKMNHKIICDPVISFKPIGTPEDLVNYWNVTIKDIMIENQTSPTIVFDLDGTLCSIKSTEETYQDVKPINEVINKLREYKKNGFRIVIYTARNMQTQKNNVGAVIANIGEVTINWLNKNEVPYDELHFGKPWGQNVVYVDDRAIRPYEFVKLDYDQLIKLVSESN